MINLDQFGQSLFKKFLCRMTSLKDDLYIHTCVRKYQNDSQKDFAVLKSDDQSCCFKIKGKGQG